MIICNEGRLVFWGFAGCFQPLGKHRLFLKASQDPHDFSLIWWEFWVPESQNWTFRKDGIFCDVSNFQARFPGLQYFVPWKGMAKEVGGCETMDGRRMKHHMLCDCVCIQSVCDRCDRCTYEKTEAQHHIGTLGAIFCLASHAAMQLARWTEANIPELFCQAAQMDIPMVTQVETEDKSTSDFSAVNPPWKMIEFGNFPLKMTWRFQAVWRLITEFTREMDDVMMSWLFRCQHWTPQKCFFGGQGSRLGEHP